MKITEGQGMKPAGRERDIQIAELKGWNVERNQYADEVTDNFGQFICYISDKPWSTNRNDAWELWDELPREQRRIVIERWEKHHGLLSDEFADVVSQAWITWKEAK